MRPGRARIAAALAALLITAAACGTELSDSERAQYLTPGSGGQGAAASGGTVTTLAPVGDAGAGPTAGPGTGTATGSGSSSGAATGSSGGPAPCAAPSTAIGVTDSTITLGGVYQLSGPVTGFAQQFLTGVRAKVAQVNASGGICGRKLEYLSRDDGFDAARNASETRALIPKVLAIAGSFSTVDQGGAAALAGTDVPDASVAGSPDRANLPTHVSHSPFPQRSAKPKPSAVYRYFYDQGARKVALVYVSLATARNLMDTTQSVFEATGFQVVKRIELSPTQFSYDATAREVAASGADVMLFLHEINAASAMARALESTPSSLRFPIYSAFSYGAGYLKLAGSAAEGSYTFLPFVPFEEAGANPPTQELIRWIQQVAPGQAPTFDAANDWTAMTLVIDALAKLQGPISRASLLASLKSIDEFDAGGVWGPTSPARGEGGCSVIMSVKGGKWGREAPGRGFICAET